MHRRCHEKHGVVLIWTAIAMVALCGIISLGVDWGRVQLVKTELQQAADAAARYAAAGMSVGAAQAQQNALAVASENRAAGVPITLDPDSDIEFGAWDAGNRTFTPLSGTTAEGANAIRITVRRTAASGNPLPLIFGNLIGPASVDVTAVAIAMIETEPREYGLFGRSSISMNGNAEVDSYDSSAGDYSVVTRQYNGNIGSNGSLILNGNVRVYGNAYYGSGLTQNGNAQVVSPGQSYQSSTVASYPAPALPSSYQSMGNFNGAGNGSTTLNPGNYHFNSFSMSGDHTLNVNGEVNVYVSGDVSLAGNINTSLNRPGNFRVHVLSGGDVSISGNGDLRADVYAPQSRVSVSGNGRFFGRVVADQIIVNGNGTIHFDESLAPADTTSSSGTVAIVR